MKRRWKPSRTHWKKRAGAARTLRKCWASATRPCSTRCDNSTWTRRGPDDPPRARRRNRLQSEQLGTSSWANVRGETWYKCGNRQHVVDAATGILTGVVILALQFLVGTVRIGGRGRGQAGSGRGRVEDGDNDGTSHRSTL